MSVGPHMLGRKWKARDVKCFAQGWEGLGVGFKPRPSSPGYTYTVIIKFFNSQNRCETGFRGKEKSMASLIHFLDLEISVLQEVLFCLLQADTIKYARTNQWKRAQRSHKPHHRDRQNPRWRKDEKFVFYKTCIKTGNVYCAVKN